MRILSTGQGTLQTPYEKQQKLRIGGVKLHPQYEAKTMKYVVEHNLNTRNALFWIVGAEPRKR